MPTVDQVRERLRIETPYYAAKALRIVDMHKRLVPLEAKPAQLRFDAALEDQRARGLPRRAIVLKARKLGFSTWTQAKMIQETTQEENLKALVIAHDDDTASELFSIGHTMYVNLPDELKPPLAYGGKGSYMEFGAATRLTHAEAGGHNSSLRTQTAKNFEAGRGFTLWDVHCSEVAFWPDIERKLTAVLNAVPDVADSMVVLESTANGFNYFKEFWDDAVAGNNDFVPVFFAWFEDPEYRRPFASLEERARFEATIGDPPLGEDEPELLEKHLTPYNREQGLSADDAYVRGLEQLSWRRWAIRNKCGNRLDKFHQEYPAVPEEAFLATGRHVFDTAKVKKIMDVRCEVTDPRLPTNERPGPQRGYFEAKGKRVFQGHVGPVEVPTDIVWTPRRRGVLTPSHWRVWTPPFVPNPENPADYDEVPDGRGGTERKLKPRGAYVIGVDVSGGELEERATDEPAFHAIEVVDHRTREQVAEYRSRTDDDLLAREAFMAAMHYHEAWVAVETTGGYGAPVARILRRDLRYRRMYYRRSMDKAIHEKREDRLGWDTNTVTKPLIEANAVALVRDELDGIRSRMLAGEALTYVQKDTGGTRAKTGPEEGKFADLLMAWMIAQFVAKESHVAPETASSSATSGTLTYSVGRQRDPVTGY